MGTEEMQSMSDKALRRRERDASRRLADIAAGGDPGRGLPSDAAQAARDSRIVAARAARAEADAARAALSQREANKQTFFARMFATEAANKRRQANAPTDAEAERKAFHAELKRERDARNAADLERRRAAGLLYEPTGDGGGDTVAALFSSSALWAFTEMKIQEDGFVGQILNARHVLALWWASNLIAEHGGEAATIVGSTAPHWPDAEGDIMFRAGDIAHLERNGFIEVERQPGSGGSVTYRYGKRTRAIAESYREHLRRSAA